MFLKINSTSLSNGTFTPSLFCCFVSMKLKFNVGCFRILWESGANRVPEKFNFFWLKFNRFCMF
jgi:hypothetical protein